MGLADAAKALFQTQESKVVDDLTHERFNSARLWVLLGFVGLLLWVTHGLIIANTHEILLAVVAWLACNTVSKSVCLVMNGLIRVARIKAGTVDDGAPMKDAQ